MFGVRASPQPFMRNPTHFRHFDEIARRNSAKDEISPSGRDDKEGHVGEMREQMFCRPAGASATGPARLFAPRAGLLHWKQSYFLGL
jgi:hypothetical protein